MKKTLLYFQIITGWGGYAYPFGVWRRSLKKLPFGFLTWFWALRGEVLLLRGKLEALKALSQKHPVVLYYAAQAFYFRGERESALRAALGFSQFAPHNPEGNYLLAEIHQKMGEKEKAFQILQKEFLLSKRKTWIKLANWVNTQEDFEKINALFHCALNRKRIPQNDVEILKNLAMGAQRAGEYTVAEAIWQNILSLHPKTKTSKKKLHPKLAREALGDLLHSAQSTQLPLFLISGTLLGMVRDGQFLLHDTDLDVGVFDDVCDEKTLYRTIEQSGKFSIMPERSKHSVRIRHINGTPIDIFRHYREKDDFWHSGVKASWHNSPFSLKKATFQGMEVLIPNNPEKYLEENYGKNWHIPQKKFDSAVDCPNFKVANPWEMKIHGMQKNI